MGIVKISDAAPIANGHQNAVAKDRVTKRMIFLINLIFILLPMEGILRKWLLNPIEQPLVFIRDPVMLLLLFEYYFRYRGPKPMLSTLWIVACVVFTVLAVLQLMVSEAPPAALIIGIRNYFFFFPLTFIIPSVFGEDELKVWAKRWLILSVPIGLLVVAQFYSPVGAWLNRDINDAANTRFVVVAGVVRPYGPFTFTLAQNVFAAMMFAVTVISLFKQKAWKTPFLFYLVPYFLVFSMGALSGGRTYFVQVLITLLGVFASGFLTLNSKAGVRIIIGGVVTAAVFLFVFLFVFSDSFEYMTQRQERSVQSEGATSGRALNFITDTVDVLPETPVFGYGLGVGTIGGAYLSTGTLVFTLSEYEWPRIVLELGPIFGPVVLLFRLGLCFDLAVRSLKILRRSGDASSLIFCSFAIPLIGFGPATGSNPMVSLTWFAAGIAYAFARVPASIPAVGVPNGRRTISQAL